MPKDILKEIIDRRKADIGRLGFCFGCRIPEKRQRAVHPFIAERGAILEVKRASPSKGDIAPSLDAGKTARKYAEAGARAISCLTETNYFKGTLVDLMDVCAAVDSFAGSTGKEPPAVLRKDFLLFPEEIDVAYRAGADAVLLIARILSAEELLSMAERCASLGISALVEVRTEDDVEKMSFVMNRVGNGNFICGVNSRDLRDFSVDTLIPAAMLGKIRRAVPGARVAFESGILSPQAAAFAARMDFSAILMGEAAAKNPDNVRSFTDAFGSARAGIGGANWVPLAEEALSGNRKRPFVKVCGITRESDAVLASSLGADFLGFVMWSGSKRNVRGDDVRRIKDALVSSGARVPRLVGVVVDVGGGECADAVSLVESGVLDFLQVHTLASARAFVSDPRLCSLPHYCAVNVASADDVRDALSLFALGEPRVLIDASSRDGIGGTGVRVDGSLVRDFSSSHKLWLAGGISPSNVRSVVAEFSPELVDVSSSLESAPGIKDEGKMREFFSNLG